MEFKEFNFNEKVLKGTEAAQYIECMPVQEQVFPHTLAGKDILVQSQTGSGKTAAFLLTILNHIAESPAEKPVKALIVVPTRELAVQIEDDAKLLSEAFKQIQVGSFYGGVGYNQQEAMLSNGVDIIIGTPGRLIDFSKSNKIDCKEFTHVVIDEADRLFDMGFYPDIRHILNLMVAKESRQTMLFSATLSTRVRNLAWEFMNEPATVEIEPENVTVDEIRQELYHVSRNEKFDMLLYLLSKHNLDNALIFTNTKIRAVEVAKRLELNGYHIFFLNGDLPQRKRLKIIEKMKSGEIKFLVATDVAARGIHVDNLQLVINYDIPEDFENYVHRIGRTARAGNTGLAITLACEEFVYGLEAIQDYIGMKIPVGWLEEQELESVEDKSKGINFRTLIKGTDAEKTYSRSRSPSGSRSSGNRQGSGGPRSRSGSGGRKPSSSGSRNSRAAAPAGKSPQAADKRKSPSSPKRNPRAEGSDAPQRRKASGYRSAPEKGRRQNRPKKDYSAIESLSLEERLAHYRKEFELSTGDAGNKNSSAAKPNTRRTSGQKPASGNGSAKKYTGKRPQQQKAQPQSKKPAASSEQEPEAALQPEKSGKGSFLSRLLGRDKK